MKTNQENKQEKFHFQKRKVMGAMLAATALGSVLLTGCAEEPVVSPNRTTVTAPEITPSFTDTFMGMYKADEPLFPMEAYTGNLVIEGYRGTTETGGIYTMPAIDETIAGGYGANANSSFDDIAVEILKTVDGTKGYIAKSYDSVDFCEYGMVEVKDPADDYSALTGVYEIYTGKVITPEEFNYLHLRNYSSMTEATQAVLDQVEEEYVAQAMYDERLSPEGLQLTLELAKQRYLKKGLPVLDANGQQVSVCFPNDYDFRENYRYRYIKEMACGRDVIYYLDMDIPGAVSIKENMLAAAEAFAAANAGYDISVLSGNWVAGRYMVFRMEMYTESITQYRYFFLNLLTGEEETYQQVYANMGMDKQILNAQISQMVDEDYQQYYEMKSGTPFNWEHNEQLYQKTMALANADGVMLIPGTEEILVYYYAYVGENSAPVQRELHISPLHWSEADKTVAVITQGDMAMYPGLDKLFEGNFSTNPDVGYLNYGVWQCNDVVVIGIGWYDSNMNWCGYETLCINETSHKTVDFYGVLSNAGMDGQTFENQLRTYLESQRDFPG